ncbi:phosphodiester glycosidase family protein [Candidatus Gottesmanbacteria bacterium]|nr:phosphodiester glycosidase family protein [Candidatus Gottesmanbacteria bacterium]
MLEKLFSILFGFFLTLGSWTSQGLLKIPQTPTSSPIPSFKQEVQFPGISINIPYDTHTFTAWIWEVPKSKTVTLLPNFSQKEDGEALAKANSCEASINGGFYLEEEKPLGLFMTGGKTYSPEIQSNLATGFFWQEKSGKRYIEYQKPQSFENLDFILQTGPLFPIGKKRLQLVDDEYARRSVIAQTDDGKFFLISITEKDNILSGPFLSDLPVILSSKEVKNHVVFEKGINLDGGSASFFYLKQDLNPFVFPELKSVGSVLCIH